MTLDELKIKTPYRCSPYMEECNCGSFNIVYTQSDNHPEYYTEAHVSCINPECKQLVKFLLPVN